MVMFQDSAHLNLKKVAQFFQCPSLTSNGRQEYVRNSIDVKTCFSFLKRQQIA